MNTLFTWPFLLLAFAGILNRHQDQVIEYLKEENQVLRELLGKKRLRFTDLQRRRFAERAKALGRQVLDQLGCIVTPDTLMRWYRDLVARKYDGSKKRNPGRPSKSKEIRELILRMAQENLTWGYTRIQGALENLGHAVGRSTVRRVMLKNGLDPSPMRKKGMTWKMFLEIHWDQIAGADFFTMEVMALRGLRRYLILFGLGNRLVEPALEMQGRVGWIECKQRLGGLLKYYCRRAA